MARKILHQRTVGMRSGIRKGPRENTQEFRKNIPIGGWGLTCKYTTKHARTQGH